MIVPAIVSSEIVVRIDDLPPGQLDLLKGALCFKNEEREKQEKLKLFGFWDLPETISLWREERRRGGDHVLCMPRGFAAQLVGGLASVGATVEWDDQRSSVLAAPSYYRPFLLRDYQAEFVADLLRAEQGVGMAPTAAGKTVAALGLMALLGQRSIVIVDSEALLEQWRMRAAQFYGFEIVKNDKGDDLVPLEGDRTVGKIGKGIWEERDLTICLRQTLSSRQWETDALEWGSRWGLYVIDELHHLGSAETLQEVVRALPCRYAFGLSATPARTETQGLVSGAIVGPLVAKVERQKLVDVGILVQPTVRVEKTAFEADFWVDHDSDADGNCQKPDCKKKTPHGHRNNYNSVLKLLVESKSRNKQIAETIVAESDRIHLVGSKQKKHLDLIEKALKDAGYEHPIYKLRGEENAKGESQAITQELIREGAGVLLSTVAGEGLDVPPLDRLHMIFPIRQQAATIQIVGRVERAFPGKTSALVIDYHDHLCSVFDEQHRERMRTYRAQGLRMESQSFDERPPAGGEDEQAADDQESAPAGLTNGPQPAPQSSGEMVVLVCGSRGWGDRAMIERYIRKLAEQDDDRSLVVIHGGAKGADTIAGEVATDLGAEVRVFEANWSRGKSAGNARNIEMLDEKPERVGAFSLGTSGTRHTVEVARERGIPVDLHGPKGLVRR